MNIGLISDCLGDLSFEEFLAACGELGITQVELGCGN